MAKGVYFPHLEKRIKSQCRRKESCIMMKPPEQRRPGGDFDDAVETEANERYGPGDQSGDDGDQAFETVVGNGEIFQSAPALDKLAAMCGGDIHYTLSM